MVRRVDVVRIETDQRRGTGFLIAPDRIVTALHVLGSIVGGRLQLNGSVRVKAASNISGTLSFPIAFVTDVERIGFDAELDVAWIEIDPSSLPNATVLPIGDSTRVGVHDPWKTFGFPASAPDDGKATTGSVQSTGVVVRVRSRSIEALQLFSLEAAAGVGGRVSGYSGAPVMVGDRAVAIMSAAQVGNDARADEGTLYGIPLADVAQRLGVPLDGLPPLPPSIGFPPQPYRGLHRFERDHARLLFGRDSDVATVIGAIDRASFGLVLLTGQAGAGKSSLLEAGLLPRLEARYDCRYVRVERGDLRAAWQSATTGDWLGEEARSGRPLLVVVDQVEEAWRDDGTDVRTWVHQDFARCVREGMWLPGGRLVLSFRKEWSAEIQKTLNDAGAPSWEHVLLMPLERRGVVEAVHGIEAFERYGVSVEAGLGERFADRLLADPQAPRAPTLQVWLSELYDRDANRRLTASALDMLVRDGASLADFLDRQLRRLPADVVESGLALDLLAFHVNASGAAIARPDGERAAAYPRADHVAVAKALDAAGLLVPFERGAGYRLIHDTLGPVVLDRLATSRSPAQRATRHLQAQRSEWLAGPSVPDARGRLAATFDHHELEIVSTGLPSMRATGADDDALLVASREAVVVQRALLYRSEPPRALATLLDAATDPSPVVDHVAYLVGDRFTRPLTTEAVTTVAMAADGSVMALAFVHSSWISILDPTGAQDAFKLDAIPSPSLLAVSHDGAWVAVASQRELCVLEIATGTRTVLEGAVALMDEVFISSDGDVVLANSNGIFGFPRGATKPAWKQRRSTDDTFIHSVHGMTEEPPMLVCGSKYGLHAEYILAFAMDGREVATELGKGHPRVTLHPHAARVGIVVDKIALELDLERAAFVERWEFGAAKEMVLAFAPSLTVVARIDDKIVLLEGAEALESRRGSLGLNINIGEDPSKLGETERLLAAHTHDGWVFILTSERVLRKGSRGWEAVRIEDFAPHISPRVIGQGDRALCLSKHFPHEHVIAVDFTTKRATPLLKPGRVVAAHNATAVGVFESRPFLIAARARVDHTTVIALNREVRSATQADGVVVTWDGSVLEERADDTVRRLELACDASERVQALAHSRGRTFAAVGAPDGRGLRCAVAGPSPPFELIGLEANSAVDAFGVSPDGRWLIGGGGDPNRGWPLHLWNIDAGPRRRTPHVLRMDTIGGAGPHFAFSPNGRFLATSFDDPVVWVWDVSAEAPQPVFRVIGDQAGGDPWVCALRFRSDNRLAILWGTTALEIYDVGNDVPYASSPASGGNRGILSAYAAWCVVDRFDGRWLISTREIGRPVRLARLENVSDMLVSIDNNARWLMTGMTATRSISAIDPYAALRDPIPLGTPLFANLDVHGKSITVIERNQIRHTRLDALAHLREHLVRI